MSKMMDNLARVLETDEKSRVLRSPSLFLIQGGLSPHGQIQLKEKQLQRQRALIIFSAATIILALTYLLFADNINALLNPTAIISNNATISLAQQNQNALNLIKSGNLAAAESALRAINKAFPREIEPKINLAYALKALKEYREAELILRQLSLYSPNEAIVHNNLGALYLEMNRFEAAKESFQQALKASNEYADPMLNLAIVYEKTGSWAAAAESYRKYLKNPGSDFRIHPKLKERLRRIDSLAVLNANKGGNL